MYGRRGVWGNAIVDESDGRANDTTIPLAVRVHGFLSGPVFGEWCTDRVNHKLTQGGGEGGGKREKQ